MESYLAATEEAIAKLVGEIVGHILYRFVITGHESGEKITLHRITGHFAEEATEISKT